MSKKIIVNVNHRVTRVGIVEDGDLAEVYIERPLQHRVVGNIYKGIVENVLPGMQAAFVDIGLEKNAFLYVGDVYFNETLEEKPQAPSHAPIEKILSTNDEIIVQVTKEPFGNKGARLTGQLTIPGRYVVLVPGVEYVGVSRRIEDAEERERLKRITEKIRPENMGLIVRTVAEGVEEKSLHQDLQFLLRLWERIKSRYIQKKAPSVLYQDLALPSRTARDLLTEEVDTFLVDDYQEYEKIKENLEISSPHYLGKLQYYSGSQGVFEKYGIEQEIQKALERTVRLKSGGYLVIEETEALTVIDVNTGRYIGKNRLSETVFRTNLEAAREIARQIRLRDIGGIIVIDFIDMDNEDHQQKILDELNQAVKNDRTRTFVIGLTGLGLVEMTRKKVRQDLATFLQRPCTYCSGTGRVLTPLVVCSRVERELKKYLPREKAEAVLVETHPEVAALLIGSGGSNLRKLEEEIGKYLFFRGNDDMHQEKYRILATGTREEINRKALPVSRGETHEVLIEEPHTVNSGNGIARLHGFVLEVEQGGNYVGQKVQVEIKEVSRTFARAEIV